MSATMLTIVRMDAHAELLAGFKARDRRALARILSLVEAGETAGLESPPPCGAGVSPALERPRVVGITGSGGAGKSTLIATLIRHLRGQDKRVAVLACDPQSPKTGGALLGDRVRVKIDPADEGVYFRSISTRGAAGGISAAVGPMIPWLAAFGFDVIVVETVGIGQDQVAAREVVDTLVLLVTPGAGDEVQWEKAGVIEVVDLIAVNKSDQPGADRVRQQLIHSQSLADEKNRVRVLAISATTGAGVAELWMAIEQSASAT